MPSPQLRLQRFSLHSGHWPPGMSSAAPNCPPPAPCGSHLQLLPPLPSAQGAKIMPLLLSVSVGLALRFLVAPPLGVSMQAWTLLSIFLSTITGWRGGFIL